MKYSESWDKFIDQLKAFYDINGHCDVPLIYKENEWLAHKVHYARQRYKIDKVPSWVVSKLNELGFKWQVTEHLAKIKSTKLFITSIKKFYKLYGHSNVPSRYKNHWLARKVQTIRQQYKNGKLDTSLIDLLNQMKFDWVLKETDFPYELFLEKLQIFFEKYHNCNVTKNYNDKWLAKKTIFIRKLNKEDRLPQWFVEKLNKMHFSWIRKNAEKSRDLFIEKLNEFKQIYGHCNVPQNYPDKWLAWKVVDVRRINRKKQSRRGCLDQILLTELNKLGFDFRYLWTDARWDKLLIEIVDYYNKYGHCEFSKSGNKNLLSKISYLRKSYKVGKLSQKIINRLDKLSFVWNPKQGRPSTKPAKIKKHSQSKNHNDYDTFFKNILELLIEFKKIHGHCNVPSRYSDNYLTYGITKIRKSYKLGMLQEWMIKALNEINFQLDGKRAIKFKTTSNLKFKFIDNPSIYTEDEEFFSSDSMDFL